MPKTVDGKLSSQFWAFFVIGKRRQTTTTVEELKAGTYDPYRPDVQTVRTGCVHRP